MDLNKTYNEDCVDTMKRMLDSGVKVDCTVTSPPYDTIRNYKGTLVWNFDVFKEIAEYLYKVTADGGVLVWVVGDKVLKGSESGTSFRQALTFMDIGFRLHDTMVFAKNNPVPLNHNRYEQAFEYMFVFSKGKPKTFNGLRVPTKTKVHKSTGRFRKAGDDDLTTSHGYTTKADKLRGNIWYYNVGRNQSSKDAVASKHPAIFPEQLAEDHIRSWTNPGDLVYDPFMGSGTVAKAALIQGRNYVGSEKVKDYCDITEERLRRYSGKE